MRAGGIDSFAISLALPAPCSCYSAVAVNIFHIINTFSVDITNNNFCSPTHTYMSTDYVVHASLSRCGGRCDGSPSALPLKLFTFGPHRQMTALEQDTLRASVSVHVRVCECACACVYVRKCVGISLTGRSRRSTLCP